MELTNLAARHDFKRYERSRANHKASDCQWRPSFLADTTNRENFAGTSKVRAISSWRQEAKKLLKEGRATTNEDDMSRRPDGEGTCGWPGDLP